MSELVVGDFVLKLAVTIEIIIAGNIPCVEDVLKEDNQGRVSGSCRTRNTGYFPPSHSIYSSVHYFYTCSPSYPARLRYLINYLAPIVLF